MKPPLTSVCRRFSRSLLPAGAAIVCLAAIPRLLVRTMDPAPFLWSDSSAYIVRAFTLDPGYDRPLGYSLFLRLLFSLHPGLDWIADAQAILGIATVVGFAWLGWKYLFKSSWAFRLCAVLLALELSLVLYERYILSEALAVFLLLPFFYFYVRLLVDRRPEFGFATGFLVACLIVVRVVFYFCIPIVVGTLLLDSLRRYSRPRAVEFAALVLSFLLGLGIPLAIYGGYYQFRAGSFGVTNFDGYTLWFTAGHPDICRTAGRDAATEIICNAPASQAGDRRSFKNIWGDRSPARLLERTLGSRYQTNIELRRLALESIRLHPLVYIRATAGRIYELFFKAENYAKRRELESWGRDVIEDRWGPGHPSTTSINSPIWKILAIPMRVHVLYAVVVIIFGFWTLLQRHWRPLESALLIWIGAYVSVCALTTPSGMTRMRVVVVIPMILVAVVAAERVVERIRSLDRMQS